MSSVMSLLEDSDVRDMGPKVTKSQQWREWYK